jgi:hypothetical protein
MDLMPRIIRIVVAPRDEWPRIAAERWYGALVYTLVLSLVPALASPEMSAALITYLATAGSVLTIAAAFWILARLFAPAVALERCIKVAAYGATPLFLASALLVIPVLVIVCVISLVHVFYLYYLGVQQLMGVPQAQAAQFVAIALVLAIVASTLGGGAVGTLGLL